MERRCGIMFSHILRIPSHPSHAPHPPHILRSAAYVRGYRDGVFQTRWILWLSILASTASPRTTTLRCVCTGLRRWRLPGTPHILRSAAYVRGYRDSVFQTHGGMWLSILASTASPRTYYAPLCMYGVTEIASSRRMGAWALYPHIPVFPAHSPLRYVCTGVQRWRLPDAWGHGLSILASPASPRTYYAPLRMYGVTEIASSRRMGACGSLSSHPPHLPAHTTLRCVCTGLQR